MHKHEMDAELAQTQAMDAEDDLRVLSPDRVDDLDEVSAKDAYVRLGVHESDHRDRSDPEADVQRAMPASAQARMAMRTPTGQLVVAGLIGLVGVTCLILAITIQSWPFLATAAVVAPFSFFHVRRKYRRWLQRKRFDYRLMETLGEDTSGMQAYHDLPTSKVGRHASRR